MEGLLKHRFFLILCIMATLANSGWCQSKYPLTVLLHCAREPVLLQAFALMNDGQTAESSLDWIVDKPVRVLFKNMIELDKRLKNYDAISWISNRGEQVIFINQKHQNAPPAALAAIIAHEALHRDTFNSIQEEIAGWRTEALVWHEKKQENPLLANILPGTNPLVDRLNRIELAEEQGQLDPMVRNNPGYLGLPEHSPGF